MEAVKLSSVFRYPGGKSKMLPLIMEHLESLVKDNSIFIEPFVGGGSVFLHIAANYPKINTFYINDKDYGVFAFWTVVTGGNDLAIKDLCDLIKQPPTVKLHKKLKKDTSTDLIMSAYKTLFFNRCNFSGIQMSGMIGGEKQEGKYKIDCRYNSDKLIEKIKKINEVTRNKVIASNLDVDQYHVLWDNEYPTYIDPPYVNKGQELYPTYMMQDEHINLANKLSNRKNWLLSYDDCTQVRNLYQNNNIIDLSVRYSINGKKNQWANKQELLIKG